MKRFTCRALRRIRSTTKPSAKLLSTKAWGWDTMLGPAATTNRPADDSYGPCDRAEPSLSQSKRDFMEDRSPSGLVESDGGCSHRPCPRKSGNRNRNGARGSSVFPECRMNRYDVMLGGWADVPERMAPLVCRAWPSCAPLDRRKRHTLVGLPEAAATRKRNSGRSRVCCSSRLFSFAFARVASEVTEGETRFFGYHRCHPRIEGDRSGTDPIGPQFWFEEAVRDITSLGSNVVLVGIALTTDHSRIPVNGGGSLRRGMAGVRFRGQRDAPDSFLQEHVRASAPSEFVAHSLSQATWSFPSGHATMSAVTYLTLGALLARVQPHPALKAYLLSIAVLLTLLVGTSRVYLGVHWPTDVLAGWCLGSAWALGWWLVAVRLQRRGRVEKRIDG